MYSLFWKIFFTFWLIILVTELVTAWITAELSEYELHPILVKQNDEFVASSTQAVSILTKRGLLGLREWLQHKNNMKGMEDIYVINKRHEEIYNKPLPENVKAILRNDYYSQALIDHYRQIKHTLSIKTITPDGEEYLLVSTFKQPRLVKYLLAPQRILFSVLISGIICFLLARYFTSPLDKLRRSTQMLTLGKFNTSNLQNLRNRNDEFGGLARDFEHMAERLSDVLDSQRQLLRDISHELRSPLARISVALDLARNNKLDKGKELDRIEKEAERLEFLIRELLTFVRIEPGNKSTSRSNVVIHDLLSQVVNDAQYEQQKTNTASILKLECPDKLEISADAFLLHRAVENIVRNACYYSPKDTVIHVRCKSNARNLTITIEDEGSGVPEDMLDRIFQPFVRVSSARETETGGTGIGLAIAKRVIDLHNGTITANNKKNNSGLIVKITLPIQAGSLEKYEAKNLSEGWTVAS